MLQLRTTCLVVIAVVALGGVTRSQVQFYGPSAIASVGSEPCGLVLVDLNGDGVRDLAVCNRTSDTVTVKFGNGAGGFTGGSTYSVGTFPQEIAAADLNNDGITDLLCSNRNTNTLSFLRGQSGGTFAAAQTRNTQSLPRGIAIRDFNNDGSRDAAIVCEGANVVEIRPNTDTNGAFVGDSQVLPTLAAFTLSTNASPDQIATGDVDNDGDRDIIVTHNSTPGRIKVFKYTGSGALGPSDFTAMSPQSFGTNLRGIRAVQMNGDGILDLVVVQWTLPNGAIHVLLGNAAPRESETGPIRSQARRRSAVEH